MNELEQNMQETSNTKAFNQEITLEEVIQVVKGSKNGKTVNGNIDPLPNEILKTISPLSYCTRFFLNVFNMELDPVSMVKLQYIRWLKVQKMTLEYHYYIEEYRFYLMWEKCTLHY